MLNDRYLKPGQPARQVGAGTHTRLFWDEYQAGQVSEAEWIELESRMTRSPGTCNTMGTASTMTAIVEALGLALPGSTAIPAMDAGHTRMATDCGERIVQMVLGRPRAAIAADARRLSSTPPRCRWRWAARPTPPCHIVALARRAGVDLTLDDLDAVGRRVPVLANLFPSGDRLMEDFHYAGGLPALMTRITAHLSLGERNVNGRTLGENLEGVQVLDDEVIRPLERPVSAERRAGRAARQPGPRRGGDEGQRREPEVLPAPRHGTGLRPSRRDAPRLRRPRSRLATRNTVLVLRNAGPVGAPGMPEWGRPADPEETAGARGARHGAHLRRAHERHPLRHLHPPRQPRERGRRAAGLGPQRRCDRDRHRGATPASGCRCRPSWHGAAPNGKRRPLPVERGFVRLYREHVTQAHEGCDFDFLQGAAPTPEPVIY
jgi:dihydroxy-acid dehydratase